MHELTAEQEKNSASLANCLQPTLRKRRLTIQQAFSYALIACAAFVVIDSIDRLRSHDAAASPEKSAIWWAYKNWREQPKKPDLVMLGSSLMIAAQNDCDATYYDETFDAVKHYHSEYLESKLSQSLRRPFTTASFVVGGQMATDAYAIISTVLSNQQPSRFSNKQETLRNTPQLPSKNPQPSNTFENTAGDFPIIVWGIAPRDFLDATFGRAEDTETVRLMNRISGQSDLLHLRKQTFWTQIEELLNKGCSIYGNRNEFRTMQQVFVERCLNGLHPGTTGTMSQEAKIPDWLLHQTSLAFPEDNRIGQWIVRPCNKKGSESRDNSVEYKERYATFKQQLFTEQLHFYEQAMDCAIKNGFKVIIVNMPLTADNLSQLPHGLYAQYLQNVRTRAQSRGVCFLDLNESGRFSAKDFWDQVHLNGYGATRYMDILASKVAELENDPIKHRK